jgi:hypothetical protein
VTIQDISKATATDESLMALQHALKSGSWNNSKVEPSKMLKDEITIDHIDTITAQQPGTSKLRLIMGHHSKVMTLSDT